MYIIYIYIHTAWLPGSAGRPGRPARRLARPARSACSAAWSACLAAGLWASQGTKFLYELVTLVTGLWTLPSFGSPFWVARALWGLTPTAPPLLWYHIGRRC